MEWSVAITRVGDYAALDLFGEQEDEMLHELNQLLEEHAPAVSIRPNRYTVRISVSAPEIGKAIDYAMSEILVTSAKVGMPEWPIVDVQVTEWDEFSRQLDEPTYPNVVGVSELATMLRVSKQRASELARSPSFPDPFVELASGPVWIEPNVRHFAETWERKPGRPKKVTDLMEELQKSVADARQRNADEAEEKDSRSA